jgi:hypothetical protein
MEDMAHPDADALCIRHGMRLKGRGRGGPKDETPQLSDNSHS